MRNSDLCENSCAVIAQLISPFFLQHSSSSTCTQYFKILAFFRGCIGQFASDLVGNPEDRFSGDAAHVMERHFM